VDYGFDHLACNALIEPPQPLIYRENDALLMSPEAVTEILEEVCASKHARQRNWQDYHDGWLQ